MLTYNQPTNNQPTKRRIVMGESNKYEPIEGLIVYTLKQLRSLDNVNECRGRCDREWVLGRLSAVIDFFERFISKPDKEVVSKYMDEINALLKEFKQTCDQRKKTSDDPINNLDMGTNILQRLIHFLTA
jgi:hypothetical protein